MTEGEWLWNKSRSELKEMTKLYKSKSRYLREYGAAAKAALLAKRIIAFAAWFSRKKRATDHESNVQETE